MSHAWQHIVQQAIQNLSKGPVKVDFSVVCAVVESAQVVSEFKRVGKLNAPWNPHSKPDVVITETGFGWQSVDSK